MTMKVKVMVRQFEFGNQGKIDDIKTITRELHTSSYYGPEGNGCCSPIVKKQTYQWISYEGMKYKVQEHWSRDPENDIHFEINLPGKQFGR